MHIEQGSAKQLEERIEVISLAEKSWGLELNEYIRQGEPDKIEKSNAWKTAIGLGKMVFMLQRIFWNCFLKTF